MGALSCSLGEIVYPRREIPSCRAEKVWQSWVDNNRGYALKIP